MANKNLLLTFGLSATMLFLSCKKETLGVDDKVSNTQSTEILWSTKLSHTVNVTKTHYPAIDDEGNVYIVTKEYSKGSVIQSFDSAGKKRWETRHTIYPRNTTIAYYKDNVYFLSNKALVCLDAHNGNEQWVFSESIENGLKIGNQDNFTFVNDKLLIPLINSKGTFLMKIDAKTGNDYGTIKISKQNRVVPRIAAKGELIYLAEDSLYACNETGVLWHTNIANTERTTKDVYDLMITQKDKIIVSVKNELNNHKLIYSYQSGNLLWSKDYGTRATIPKVNELRNGSLVFSMGDLVKVDAEGNDIWKLNAEILKSFDVVNVAADGNIYGGNAYHIFGINNMGEIIFDYDANNDPLSNSILQNKQNIVVMSMGTDESLIHCIKAINTGGLEKKTWAKWGANAANTFNIN